MNFCLTTAAAMLGCITTLSRLTFVRYNMIFARSFLVFLAGCAVARVLADDSSVTAVYARLDTDITLPCAATPGDEGSTLGHVQWLDYVYNSDQHPLLIFSSRDNPSRLIHRQHPQRQRYRVNSAHSLTISTVAQTDAGRYVCSSDLTGQWYYLTVYSEPRCEGVTSLPEGGGTRLSCQAEFVGEILPSQLSWQRSRDPIKDDDEQFGIRLARRDVTLTSAGRHDDGVVYTCLLSLNDVIERCSLTLNVSYAVDNISLSPRRAVYHVGDEVRCTADGNPAPGMSLQPVSGRHKSGDGWTSVIIMDMSWTQLQCNASNVVDGRLKTVSDTIRFTVRPASSPPTVATLLDEPTAQNENEQSVRAHGPDYVNIAIVVGVVIGITLLVVIIVVSVYLRLRRDRRRQAKETEAGQ